MVFLGFSMAKCLKIVGINILEMINIIQTPSSLFFPEPSTNNANQFDAQIGVISITQGFKHYWNFHNLSINMDDVTKPFLHNS